MCRALLTYDDNSIILDSTGTDYDEFVSKFSGMNNSVCNAVLDVWQGRHFTLTLRGILLLLPEFLPVLFDYVPAASQRHSDQSWNVVSNHSRVVWLRDQTQASSPLQLSPPHHQALSHPRRWVGQTANLHCAAWKQQKRKHRGGEIIIIITH